MCRHAFSITFIFLGIPAPRDGDDDDNNNNNVDERAQFSRARTPDTEDVLFISCQDTKKVI